MHQERHLSRYREQHELYQFTPTRDKSLQPLTLCDPTSNCIRHSISLDFFFQFHKTYSFVFYIHLIERCQRIYVSDFRLLYFKVSAEMRAALSCNAMTL